MLMIDCADERHGVFALSQNSSRCAAASVGLTLRASRSKSVAPSSSSSSLICRVITDGDVLMWSAAQAGFTVTFVPLAQNSLSIAGVCSAREYT
ncbi:hypothetical protein P3T22_000702 [Paraburkholderia sp. GAS348]